MERGVKFIMKKIYVSTAAVVMAVAVSMVSVFAAVGSSITVKTDKSEVSYTYKAGDNNEAKADASKLFGNFRNASKDDFTTENFTITSKTQNGSNIEVALLVEAAAVSEDYSPLDYYSFVITAENGDVLYDSAAEGASDVSATSKEIPFGKFNTQYTTDTKKFAVDYKINNDVAAKIDEETLAGVTVSVVSHIVKAEPAATDAPAAEADDYTVEVAASDPEEVVAAASTATAAPAAAASPTPEAIEVNEVKKVCGKDMTAGRYLVSGNGIVRIQGADGTLKSETTVTDGSSGVDGVGAFVASIVDGDVITASPLPGKDKPSVKFEKTNSPTSPTAANAAAANANSKVNATKATAKATAAPTAKPKTAAAKANPKTGEDSAEIAWICGLMAAMAAGVVGLEIVKRKKAN